MRFSVRPKRTMLSLCAGGESNQSALVVECIADNGSGILEIGERHIFASSKNRKLLSRRRLCDLQVWIKRRSSLNDEAAAELGGDKVGELTFVPPSVKTDFHRAVRGCLEAFVILDDSDFEILLNTFVSGKRPQSLLLELEWEPGKGALRFGWEPDGSRIEWRINDLAESASVDIVKLTIGIDLFR